MELCSPYTIFVINHSEKKIKSRTKDYLLFVKHISCTGSFFVIVDHYFKTKNKRYKQQKNQNR